MTWKMVGNAMPRLTMFSHPREHLGPSASRRVGGGRTAEIGGDRGGAERYGSPSGTPRPATGKLGAYISAI